MSDEPSNETNPSNPENQQPEPLSENPPAEKQSVPQTVKVDLGELRELLEGLPEKTAQFIKEAVSTPKKAPARTEAKSENAPEQPQNTTPKQSAKSNRGWLARALHGE